MEEGAEKNNVRATGRTVCCQHCGKTAIVITDSRELGKPALGLHKMGLLTVKMEEGLRGPTHPGMNCSLLTYPGREEYIVFCCVAGNDFPQLPWAAPIRWPHR